MAGDENRIEIIIDAAETKSAAKSATEANQRLSEFRKALDAFQNGVGDLNKTIETNTTTVANFNTFLKDFGVKLNDNLSKMQESVIKDFEPRLEKNLENMVARAINKVEAKTSAPGKESRSRSEPKAGAGVPSGKVATVKQPEGYEKPDAVMRETIDSVRKRIIDPLTGAVQEATTQRTKTTTTRVERFQETRDDGEVVNVERKINDVVNSVSKIGSISDVLEKTKFTDNPVEKYLEDINTKWKAVDPEIPDFAGSISDAIEKSTASHTWASPMDQFSKTMQKPIENIYGSGTGYGKPVKEKGEKKSNNWADPSNMMRREITGALIALHVMKVVAGNSQVAASGFNMISNAVGHLLNVALLPMIPIFSMFAQLIHQVANVINSMPYGIRILIGGLVMWKATSALIASMPIRDFTSGIRDMRQALSGGGDNLRRFGEIVKGIISFMNSGLQQGRLQGAAEWLGSKIRGKRAGGGPVGKSNAYVVGEKGPELFVPDSSGTIVPNSAFRADGGGVEEGGGLPFGDILGSLGAGLGAGGLTYLLTGSPLLAGGVGVGAAIGPAAIAQSMSTIISSEIGQQVIGSLNVLTGMISSMFAPLAPIFGILSVALGVVTGLKGGGGGGDKGAETTAKVGTAINSTVARGNFGIQSSLNSSAQGNNKMLSLLLLRLNGCIQVAPCAAAVFPTAPIGGGDPTATPDATRTSILDAIRELPSKLRVTLGEFITEATVKVKSIWERIPLPDAIADRIAKIRSIWEPTPAAETLADRTAKIVYNVETVGERPVVVDTAAKIRYNIETVGSAPVANDVTAKIKYNIETTGTVPVATDISAKARYTVETVGTLPVTTDIAAKIEVKSPPETDVKIELAKTQTLLERNPLKANYWLEKPSVEQYNKWLEDIGKLATDKPPKIAATLDVPVGSKITVPESVTAKVPAELAVPRGTKITLPDGTTARIPITVESAPDALAKSINDAIAEAVKSGKKFTFPAAAEVNGYINKAGEIYLNAKATITDFSKGNLQNVEVDATARIIRAVNKGGEVYIEVFAKDGEIKGIKLSKTYIDVAPSEKSMLTFNEIIAKRAGTVKVPVEPTAPEGFNPGEFLKKIDWKTGFKSLGEIGVIGLFLGLEEYARTGTINMKDFLISLGIGTITFAGAQAILTGMASSLLGAAAAGAVTTAFGLVGVAISGYIALGTAGKFAEDLSKGVSDAVKSGDFGSIDFGNFVLNAAKKLGQDFNATLEENGIEIDPKVFQLAGVGIESGLQFLLNPSEALTKVFPEFVDKFRAVVNGGIPVDVKFDVESLTTVVRETTGGTPISGGARNPEEKIPECPQGQYWDRALQKCATPAGSVIPSHAFGGYVTPGVPNLVGERGPELFVPMTGGQIIPNGDLKGGNGGGSNVTNNFTFNVTANNPRELTETVMRELKMELARVKM